MEKGFADSGCVGTWNLFSMICQPNSDQEWHDPVLTGISNAGKETVRGIVKFNVDETKCVSGRGCGDVKQDAKGVARQMYALHNCASLYISACKEVLASIDCGKFDGNCIGHIIFFIATAALTEGAGEFVDAADVAVLGAGTATDAATATATDAAAATGDAAGAADGAIASEATAAESGNASLPGSAGVQIPGRLDPQQMAALSEEHGVEFALVYRTGDGEFGRGGTYWLYSGESRAVSVPVGSDVRLIYHTHPAGTRIASPADMALMDLQGAAGSPQRSSQIVVPNGSTVRFGGPWSRWGNRG